MIEKYGILGLIGLARHWLLTRLIFPHARLVRFPIHVRGKRSIQFGQGLTTGVNVRLDAFPTRQGATVLFFGNQVQINDSVHIGAIEHVEIGDHSLIASRVFISDHNHGDYQHAGVDSAPSVPPALRPLVSRPVRIGRNVWLGEHVCVLPGVTIGDGAIVGANAVVNRDVPPHTIVAGNPARIIRTFDAASGTWRKA